MNIPEFDGRGTDSWIQTIEMYFDAARTPTESKTEIAVTYLTGPAMEWWRGTRIQANTLPWYRFCRHVGDRFAENSVCDNVRAFHALIQSGSLNDYILKFEQHMNLMRRDNPALPNDYFKNSFIAGLHDSIQHYVQCHESADLQRAIWLARRMEQAQPPRRNFAQFPPTAAKKSLELEQPRTNINNTPAVIQQARLKGICYKCKETWFPGHKKVCKMSNQAQIQALQEQNPDDTDLVYVTEMSEEMEQDNYEPPDQQQLQISMHALMEISNSKFSFTVTVMVGKLPATALINSGSSATFMSPAFATLSKCTLTPTKKTKVLVANGGTLWTEFMAPNCPYTIQGEEFASDFRILKLQGYDIILGADWMSTHNPVKLGFDLMEFQITKDKQRLFTFSDESLPSTPVTESSLDKHIMEQSVCGAVIVVNKLQSEDTSTTPVHPQIKAMMGKYKKVFSSPTMLPPARACDHAIPFIPGAKVVNQRPYRLPHHQKNAMETII